jgi:hypothetical protein
MLAAFPDMVSIVETFSGSFDSALADSVAFRGIAALRSR